MRPISIQVNANNGQNAQNNPLMKRDYQYNSVGNITWQADAEAFGETYLNPNNQITMNLRFPGQYYDAETDTHYNYFRDYNPRTGRYQQSDPIGLGGGMNNYVYPLNPNQMVDIYGLKGYWSCTGNKALLGAGSGALIGGGTGAALGSVAGGFSAGAVCTAGAPGVGTVLCGTVGASGGGAAGGWAGAKVGGVAGFGIGGIWGLITCFGDGDDSQCAGDTNATGTSATTGGTPNDPNKDKNEDKYKKPSENLEKGDKIDLDKFSQKAKGSRDFIDPKSGWRISADKAGANSHGGSAWKLLNKKGQRVGTLDSTGRFLRK